MRTEAKTDGRAEREVQRQRGRQEGQCSLETLPETQVPGQVPLPQVSLMPGSQVPTEPSAGVGRTIFPGHPIPAGALCCQLPKAPGCAPAATPSLHHPSSG